MSGADDDLLDRYYLALGAAFARGRLGASLPTDVADDEAAFRAGRAAGLKMHKFKRNA